MISRHVVIVLLVLAGPLLLFEAYGIHRLQQPAPPSPDKALDMVCEQLLQSAQAKGLHRSAREIETVSGPEKDLYFESLPPFLNARLVNGFKQFLFSDEMQKGTVQEISRLMKRREWTGDAQSMNPTVPDVVLFAEWGYFSSEEVRLTLRAVRLALSGEGVQASVRFVHPRVIQRQNEQKDHLRLALYGSAAFQVAVILISVLYLSKTQPAGGSRHGTPL
ncbi:MAG: hypothetical protein JNK54_01225 [Elusimicrobia bacterium]|nr:hypothetical protein [Elusimicrobiota bacterium]